MTCRHDYHLWDERHDEMPDCDVHVECDQGCKALTEPQTIEELRAALTHWRYHGHLGGCSHAN